MKYIVGIAAAGAVASLATYTLVSRHKDAQFAQDRDAITIQWDNEKAQLEADLAMARQKTPRLERVGLTSTNSAHAVRQSPEELLEELTQMKVVAGPKRGASARQIIHQLGNLAEIGPAAIPPIQAFLARLVDVNYGFDERFADDGIMSEEERKAREIMRPEGQEPPRLNFIFPPSLRIGLVDVLRDIGGEEAEKTLAEMLATTGRGLELAYLAKTLEEMAPRKHRELALNAARELLKSPPTLANPDRFDRQSKEYLFQVLAMYGDTASAPVAQDLLVGADGRVDKTTLKYMTSTLKEGAAPALYQAFKDPRLTNMWDKASIASEALSYAGSSPDASQLLTELVTGNSVPPWVAAMALQSMGGASFFGPVGATEPAQIRAQLDLLGRIPDPSNPQVLSARDEAVRRLTERLASKTPQPAAAAPGAEAEETLADPLITAP